MQVGLNDHGLSPLFATLVGLVAICSSIRCNNVFPILVILYFCWVEFWYITPFDKRIEEFVPFVINLLWKPIQLYIP